jgi:hypothetical protein
MAINVNIPRDTLERKHRGLNCTLQKLNICDSSYTRFRYPRLRISGFYFSIMWDVSVLTAATVGAAVQVHRVAPTV